MKWTGVFLLPLDGMLFHCRVTPNIIFVGTHLHTWAERRHCESYMQVSCPRTQRSEPGKGAWFAIEQTNHKATTPSQMNHLFTVVLTVFCFHCRGESYPDKQESPEIKSKKGPEGTESFSCIFAGEFLFLDNYESRSTSVMSLCCRPSLTLMRDNVFWDEHVWFICSAVMWFAQERENQT